MVTAVVDVIKNQFLNTFDQELQKDSLFNLVSGITVDNSICKCLTSIFSSGTALMNDFVQHLHKDGCSKSLTDTIKVSSEKLRRKIPQSKGITEWKSKGNSHPKGYLRQTGITLQQIQVTN